jgi:membrane protease YdiL (CAAX protease family)
LALLPSIALSALVRQVAADAAAPQFPGDPQTLALLVVFVGPALETLLLAVPLLLLNRLFGAGPAVIGSAVLWGFAHSIVAPVWGLVIWWPFLVMSIAFLTWRREGIWQGDGRRLRHPRAPERLRRPAHASGALTAAASGCWRRCTSRLLPG